MLFDMLIYSDLAKQGSYMQLQLILRRKPTIFLQTLLILRKSQAYFSNMQIYTEVSRRRQTTQCLENNNNNNKGLAYSNTSLNVVELLRVEMEKTCLEGWCQNTSVANHDGLEHLINTRLSFLPQTPTHLVATQSMEANSNDGKM